MAYIGKTPTAAPLTSSDVTDGIITTAKIAADAVTDAKIADDVVGTEHLTAGEVDATAIANDAITLAKMAGGTDGNIISYDASGNPVAIATGSDGQILTSTGAGSPPAFEAAPGGGKVLQVVSTNKTDQFSESTSNGGFGSLVTGFTVAITPAATSSKILVLMNATIAMSSVGGMGWALFRDTTQIDIADASSSRGRMSGGMDQTDATQYVVTIGLAHLDSPSSTSEVVYGIKLAHTSGSSKTLYLNVEASGGDSFRYPALSSNITAIEIGA